MWVVRATRANWGVLFICACRCVTLHVPRPQGIVCGLVQMGMVAVYFEEFWTRRFSSGFAGSTAPLCGDSNGGECSSTSASKGTVSIVPRDQTHHQHEVGRYVHTGVDDGITHVTLIPGGPRQRPARAQQARRLFKLKPKAIGVSLPVAAVVAIKASCTHVQAHAGCAVCSLQPQQWYVDGHKCV